MKLLNIVKYILKESSASVEAHKKGLKYAGGGQWKSGDHIVAHTVDDKLEMLKAPGASSAFQNDDEEKKFNNSLDVWQDSVQSKKNSEPPVKWKNIKSDKSGTTELVPGARDYTKITIKAPPFPANAEDVFDEWEWVDEMPSAKDFTMFKKLGGPKGSNPGGFYQDEVGGNWYVKNYSAPEQAIQEKMAGDFYNMCNIDGVGAPATKLMTNDEGEVLFGSTIIKGKLLKEITDPIERKEACKLICQGFLLDVILGNWDAIGLEEDNILISNGDDGKPRAFRIDNGGSILFRAQGGRKPEEAVNSISEWDKFFDPNVNSYANVLRDAGYSKPEDFKDELISQYSKILAIVLPDNFGSFKKIPYQSIGELIKSGTRKNYSDEIGKILLKRFQLIQGKILPMAQQKSVDNSKWTDEQKKQYASLMTTHHADIVGVLKPLNPKEEIIIGDSVDWDKRGMRYDGHGGQSRDQEMFAKSNAESQSKSFKKIPSGEYSTMNASAKWWQACPQFRRNAESKQIHLDVLEDFCQKYKPISHDQKLYRGMAIPNKDVGKFISEFKLGEEIKLPISGYSAKGNIGFAFSNSTQNFNTGVMLHLTPSSEKGMIGLHISELGNRVSFEAEREVIRPEFARQTVKKVVKRVFNNKNYSLGYKVVYDVYLEDVNTLNESVKEAINVIKKFVEGPIGLFRPVKIEKSSKLKDIIKNK